MKKFHVFICCIILFSFAWGQGYTSSIQYGWHLGYIPKWNGIVTKDGNLLYHFSLNDKTYIHSELSFESANFLLADSTKSILDNPNTSKPYGGLYFILSSRVGRVLINTPTFKLGIDAGLSVRRAYENYFFIYPSGEYGFYVDRAYQLGLSSCLNYTYYPHKRIGVSTFIESNVYLLPFEQDLASIMLRCGIRMSYNFNWMHKKVGSV